MNSTQFQLNFNFFLAYLLPLQRKQNTAARLVTLLRKSEHIHKYCVLFIGSPYTIIQLTNWILWNGKFYYRDVIKMTITRAKGEGNGHFYHIEVIIYHFIRSHSLVVLYHSSKTRKNELLLKIYKQIWDNLCASKFTGQSIFSFAHYASFDAQLCAQPRAVCADNDNGRRLSSQDYTLTIIY